MTTTVTETTAVTEAAPSRVEPTQTLWQRISSNFVLRRVLAALAKIVIVVSLTFFLIR